jgi:hypothetical protein
MYRNLALNAISAALESTLDFRKKPYLEAKSRVERAGEAVGAETGREWLTP